MRNKRFLSLLLAVVLSVMVLPIGAYARNVSLEESHARALKQLGLFKGVSDTDFDLERPATRIEAIVMLIRLLGCENDALSYHRWHPFTDVPSWADDYVGYAYAEGLSNGISATEFGTGEASSAMFLTFALRALGYDDSIGDFTWSNPYDLAGELNLIRWNVDLDNFWRADIATVSLATLEAPMKEFPLAPLADYLIFENVFTYDDYYYALMSVGESVGNLSDYHTLSAEPEVPSRTIPEEPAADPEPIYYEPTNPEPTYTEPVNPEPTYPEPTYTEPVIRRHSSGNPYLGEWYPGIPPYDENGNKIYIVNTNTGKIHVQGCDSIDDMFDSHKAVTTDPDGLCSYDPFFSPCKKSFCTNHWG